MRFAFIRRVTVETPMWVEAENEIEAWAHLIDGYEATQTGDDKIVRKPIFTRNPSEDAFDL